jgi:beta-glucosidase
MPAQVTSKPWLNADLPAEERTEQLLAEMTLEEKVAQLGSFWIYEIQAEDQSLSPQKMDARMRHGVGQVTRLAGGSVLAPTEMAETANQIQRYVIEKTRLGIPAMIHDECCSGMLARNATNFPQIIGLSSTWTPDLAQSMTEAIRTQMRAVGIHQGLAPVLDIARDPRWGRIEETFGEDPYLTSCMGVAYVRGLQGDDLAQGVVATGKHFVGYSAPEGGLNWAPAHIMPRELREVYLRPFEAVVRKAGLASMMNAYQELDGVPCVASKELLTEILRNQWGFDGIVVSDYMAINQLSNYHQMAKDQAQAALLSLEAGMDVELPNTVCYGQPLIDAVEAGELPIALVDQAVRRVLTMKFRIGVFENPYVAPEKAQAVFGAPDHRRLAHAIARKSMTLLKNEGDLLPLSKSLKSIAVIGPNADDKRNLLGDYAYPAHIESLITFKDLGFSEHPLPDAIRFIDDYDKMKSVLDAIHDAVSPDTEVIYEKGCAVLDPSTEGIAAAVEAAKKAEVAIVVVGDKSGLVPDCSTGEFRDRATLGLPGVQQELVEAIHATGTPVIVVLVNGRPFALPWIADNVPALLEAWLPGDEGAQAIADVLFGDVNPGGKLPVTVVRSAGQTPLFYNHRPSGARSFLYGPYVDESNQPLFPFGFGLSYTSFKIGNLHVTPDSVDPSGELTVSVDVTNTGEMAGDEVVQIYTRTDGASVTRPVKELRAFKRVELAPGETKTVVFTVPVAQMNYYNLDMRRVVEPAALTVMAGSSSQDIAETATVTIAGETLFLDGDYAMFGTVEVK